MNAWLHLKREDGAWQVAFLRVRSVAIDVLDSDGLAKLEELCKIAGGSS